jgi:hypothetical protein
MFSRVYGVTLPVLDPFRNIVAPEGVELTEILPTAVTAIGSSRIIIKTDARKIVLLILSRPGI